MAKRDKYYLIGKFENDDVPTGADFSDFISSSLNLHQTESYQILSSSLHISGTLSSSGDLWVSGNVEAQSYTLNNLAFVNTSTINTTGSVTFGDTASLDVHRITGSLFLSGATAQFTSTNTNFLNSVNIGTTSSPQGKLGGGLTVSNSLTMGTSSHHQSQSISSSILITGSDTLGHLAIDTNEILHWNDNLTIGSYGGSKASKGNIKFLTSMGVDSVATSSVKLFISASGRVGIGTDTPDKELVVHGDISSSGTVLARFLQLPQASGGTSDSAIHFGGTADDNGFIWDDGNHLILGYNDSDKIKINDSSPEVSINGDLEVSGDLKASCSAAPTHHAGIFAIIYDTGSNKFHYTGSYGAGGGGGDGIFLSTSSFYATTNDIEITGSLAIDGDLKIENTTPKIILKDTDGADGHLISFINNTGNQVFKISEQTIGTQTEVDLKLVTFGNERLKINSDGKVGINRTATTYQLEVGGTLSATEDVIAYMGSDRRLKDNIKPITNPIEKIKQIGGYTFDWNNNQTTYEGSDVGVIAQEIEAVLPSLVQDREDGYKGVKYDKIVSLLIEGIKEQQNQIDDLKEQINNLKS